MCRGGTEQCAAALDTDTTTPPVTYTHDCLTCTLPGCAAASRRGGFVPHPSGCGSSVWSGLLLAFPFSGVAPLPPAVVFDVSSSEAAPPPRLHRLAPLAPRESTARVGSPRAGAAAMDRHAAPPREVGPALFGLHVGVAPAPAASLSSLARPCVPTPLAEAASAHLSLPPTTDPKRQ